MDEQKTPPHQESQDNDVVKDLEKAKSSVQDLKYMVCEGSHHVEQAKFAISRLKIMRGMELAAEEPNWLVKSIIDTHKASQEDADEQTRLLRSLIDAHDLKDADKEIPEAIVEKHPKFWQDFSDFQYDSPAQREHIKMATDSNTLEELFEKLAAKADPKAVKDWRAHIAKREKLVRRTRRVARQEQVANTAFKEAGDEARAQKAKKNGANTNGNSKGSPGKTITEWSESSLVFDRVVDKVDDKGRSDIFNINLTLKDFHKVLGLEEPFRDDFQVRNVKVTIECAQGFYDGSYTAAVHSVAVKNNIYPASPEYLDLRAGMRHMSVKKAVEGGRIGIYEPCISMSDIMYLKLNESYANSKEFLNHNWHGFAYYFAWPPNTAPEHNKEAHYRLVVTADLRFRV